MPQEERRLLDAEAEPEAKHLRLLALKLNALEGWRMVNIPIFVDPFLTVLFAYNGEYDDWQVREVKEGGRFTMPDEDTEFRTPENLLAELNQAWEEIAEPASMIEGVIGGGR